jgi:hypothetical protein
VVARDWRRRRVVATKKHDRGDRNSLFISIYLSIYLSMYIDFGAGYITVAIYQNA